MHESIVRVGWAAFILAAPVALFAAEPVNVVESDAISDARQPQAAVDVDGTIYVAFGSGETVYFAKSTDSGRTYSAPVQIRRIPHLALGMRRGPRIAVGNGIVVVSAIGHQDGNLLAWHSADGGESWSDSVSVNDSPGHASEGLHAMAIGSQGQVYCVWLDHRHGTTQIYGASSADGGKSWSENRKVYASPSGNVCECCHPSAAYSSNGELYVMWRNSLNGNRDMYFAVSRNDGMTFDTARKLGNGTWMLDACPMDGGSLAVTPQGDLTTVWRRENQLFRTDAHGRSEELIGAGLQPWASATSEGVYLVWTTRRNGDLWLKTPVFDRPRKVSEGSSDPVVATSLSGNGPVVVVWEIEQQKNRGIQAVVVDAGN